MYNFLREEFAKREDDNFQASIKEYTSIIYLNDFVKIL